MAGEAAHPVNDLPPAPHGDAGGRALGIVLWCLFVTFVLIGGLLFLRACGTQAIFGFAHDFCPLVGDEGALRRAVDRGETLRRQVHLAELDLLEKPICPLPRPPEPVTPAPTPVPAPVPKPPQSPASIEMDRRTQDRGGKTGKLQLTLSWQTRDDLDLDVECPGGAISSAAHKRGPGICGDGVKDLDANGYLREHLSGTPVENIVWPTNPPEGSYTIEVVEAYAKDSTRDSAVRFKLRIRWNDQETVCDGVVTADAKPETRRDSHGLIGGVYKTLKWTLGQPLPDCNFKTETAYVGNGVKD